MSLSRTILVATGLSLAALSSIQAEVRMPSIFGDHMVLQQGKKIPVWGFADPGESIVVTLGEDSAKTVADAQGRWRVDLKPVKASADPTQLTVSGKNTIRFSDVLLGDVWLESGQSNMQFGAKKTYRGGDLVASAKEPLIRIFSVRRRAPAISPQDELPPAGPGSTQYEGKWLLCTPETLGGSGNWDGFSAVGFYFGREIQRFTHQPVGLIESVWGGTPAEAWTSIEGLSKSPMLSNYVKQHEQLVAKYDATVASLPGLRAQQEEFDRTVKPKNDAAMQKWQAEVKKATDAGVPPPPRPSLPGKPNLPDPSGGEHAPTALWNGLIAPLVPYAIEGVIWYQGESNSRKGIEYRTLFPTMITDWREHWGEGDFPFLYVQLADFREDYTLVREAQSMTLALPKAGMAVAIDVGNENDIHPIFKEPVGHRLALAAEHVAYGSDAEYSGPEYKSFTVKDGAVVVNFTHATGLKIGSYPVTGNGYKPQPTDRLHGFTVAGKDKKWHEATATIEGDTVVVQSPEVPEPVAVRYGWEAPFTICNLYNAADLPASPFRSDDWPVK